MTCNNDFCQNVDEIQVHHGLEAFQKKILTQYSCKNQKASRKRWTLEVFLIDFRTAVDVLSYLTRPNVTTEKLRSNYMSWQHISQDRK